MNVKQLFLIVAAVGLTPIALSYGLVPGISLNYLFQISVTDTNLLHIFRAIMGLYLALVIFWAVAAFKPDLSRAAIYSLVIFMLGLASGRMLSMIIDGLPNVLLVVYFVLEIAVGVIGIVLLRQPD